jgi:hypothetical protein
MWLREAGWSEERAQLAIAAKRDLVGIPATSRMQHEERQSGGRPDIVFTSPSGDRVVVVELQLGGVDHYHIAKTAEYLARERSAFPDAQCSCMLVAESFAGRYGRLAEAVARVTPIRLFRMAVHSGGLVVAQHDLPELGDIPEEQRHEDRWRATPWFELAGPLFQQIVDIDPAWSPKFNGDFIGGQRLGHRYNSLAIRGGLTSFQVELKLEQSDEVDRLLTKAGFVPEYRGTGKFAGDRRRHYLVRIPTDANPETLLPLLELVRRAHARWEQMDNHD